MSQKAGHVKAKGKKGKHQKHITDQKTRAQSILEQPLADYGGDEDCETDEEDVKYQIRRCKRDLRKAIKDYFICENPFELVRNLRTPQKSGVLADYYKSQENSEEPESESQEENVYVKDDE